MDTTQIIAELGKEIARLNRVIVLLAGTSNDTGHAPKHRPMSLEGRKRVAAAQRRRWAKARKLKRLRRNNEVDMRRL